MANELENSCVEPPVAATVSATGAAAAGAAPRRSCRARRLNTRFVNDEVDEGYRQLVARIAAPDSHSILQSPQLAFHHLSTAPPPQPTTTLSTPPSSKASVVAVSTATVNASSSVTQVKKGISTPTAVKKPSVVKRVRRQSQEVVDTLASKKAHRGSQDSVESDKSVVIKKTAKIIGNSVKKIKSSINSIKSQKSRKNQPASPESDSEDDVPLAKFVCKESANASECSSDEDLPLSKLAAKNKSSDTESYNCDLPSNYCIKTIHNPDLSSTPISIVCIEDPDEEEQLETPKVKKVKRKSFPKMFNTAKKAKLDISNNKNESTVHAVEDNKPKVEDKSPILEESDGKKRGKDGRNSKSKVKLPLKPNQGKLLKILNLKVVPTALPELPKDNPLVKLIGNKNADQSSSDTNHERTTIQFAVFSPKSPSENTQFDSKVPQQNDTNINSVRGEECSRTPRNKHTNETTSEAKDKDSQIRTETAGKHDASALVLKQESNNLMVSAQSKAGQVDYDALSSILKSESPPCLDGVIKVEKSATKSKLRDKSSVNLEGLPKQVNSQDMVSKNSNKDIDSSNSSLGATLSQISDKSSCLKDNADTSQLKQNSTTLSVTKTEMNSEQSQDLQVSSQLLAQPVSALKSDKSLEAHKETNSSNEPSNFNSLSSDLLNSNDSITKTTPNKISEKRQSEDGAKIKCKRRKESSPSSGGGCKRLKQEINAEGPKLNQSNLNHSSNNTLHPVLSTVRSPLKSEKVVVDDQHPEDENSDYTKSASRQSHKNAAFSNPKQLKADPYEQKPDLAIIRDTREQWETDDKSKALVSSLPHNEYKEKVSVVKKEKATNIKIAKKASIETNYSLDSNTSSNLSMNNSSKESQPKDVSSKDHKGMSGLPPSAVIDTKVDIKPALLITKIIDGVETEVKPNVKRRDCPSSTASSTSTNIEVKSTQSPKKSGEPSVKHQKLDNSNKSKSNNAVVKSEPLDASPVVVSPSTSRNSEPDLTNSEEDKVSAKGKEKLKGKKNKEDKIRSNMEKEKKKNLKTKNEKERSEREEKTNDPVGKVVTKEETSVEVTETSVHDSKTEMNKSLVKEHKTKGSSETVKKRDESAKIPAKKEGNTFGTADKGEKAKKPTDKDSKAKTTTDKEVKVKGSLDKDNTKEVKDREEKSKASQENILADKAKGAIENEVKAKDKSKSIIERESKIREGKSSRGIMDSETKENGEKESTGKDKSRSGIKKETKELSSDGLRRDSREKSPPGHRSSSSSKGQHHKYETDTKSSRSKSSHHRRSSSSDHKNKDDRPSTKRRDSSSSSYKSSRRDGDRGDAKRPKKGTSSSPSLVEDSKDFNVISASNNLMDNKSAALVNDSQEDVKLNKNSAEQNCTMKDLPNTITITPDDIKPSVLQELATTTTNGEELTATDTASIAKKKDGEHAVDMKPVSRVTDLLNMCRANIPSEIAPGPQTPIQPSALLVGNSLQDSKPISVNSLETLVQSVEGASSNIPLLGDVKLTASEGDLTNPISKKSHEPDSNDSVISEGKSPHSMKYTNTCAVLLERMTDLDDKSSNIAIKRHDPDSSVEMADCEQSIIKSDYVLVNNTSVDDSSSASSSSCQSPSPTKSSSSCETPSPTKREPSPPPPETPEDRERREAMEAEQERRNKLVVEQRMKSFDHLTENQYLVDRKKSKQSKEVRRMVCDCILTKEELSRGEKGCGDDCLNRLLMIECGWRCPLGDACLNRSFQRCEYGPVEVFNAEEKGCGVKATEDIPQGTFILEYIGEVFDQREFRRRRKEYGKDGTAHFYFMALKADQFIDATRKGNISRFVNHSCDPNAETQKWTVNGELRIGFFSTKTISAGEEINFDYRMERYGREPQKCYCGTTVCRGWLGEPPDELTKEEKEEEKRKTTLTAVSDKPTEKRKKEEKKQQFDDELQDDLSELRRVGMRNRQYTLMLSRVMVRAESEHTRSQLLTLLQAAHANTPCLRLFMDYHGLSLLWSWMADLSIDLEHAPLKLQILKTLDILPITNRTQVADSRVLEVVEKWSKQTPPPPSTTSLIDTNSSDTTTPDTGKKISDGSDDSDDVTVDESSQDSVDAPTSNSTSTTKLPSSDDSSSDSNSSKSRSNLPRKGLVDCEAVIQKPDQLANEEDLLRKTQSEMVELALKLVSRWQVLKEEFRIPRKQRVQLMKEHEREVEAGYRRYLNTERGRREVTESRYNSRRDSYYDSWRSKMVPIDHDKEGRRWQPHETTISINDAEFAGLSKEERREKFAQKVAIEDEQRRVQESMWNVHIERCARSGLDPYQTPIIDPSGQYYWDASNSTWVPLTPQTAYAAGVMDPATAQQHAAAMAAMAGDDPGMCYTEEVQPETVVDPHCIPTANGEVLPPVVVTINLPPHWHIARDQHNRVYFYHSRSRQTQWDIPTHDTKTTLQYETDSESDTESSSSSDSEEEFSSDDGDANDDEVAMARAGGEGNAEEPETVEGKIIRRQRGRKRHSEALVQQRVISPIRELDREQARKERREAKERARHEARRERLQYQEQLLSKELGVAEDANSDDDQDTVMDEPKMSYQPREKFKVKSKERAATAIADTSDKARKIKDLFRSRMATFIVSVLNPYRRVDCKQGRINTTEDFKYLARKLTHFVMVKELKQLPSIEGLDCSDSVKHKTKDFVRKYMAKYGSSFKRDPNDTKEY